MRLDNLPSWFPAPGPWMRALPSTGWLASAMKALPSTGWVASAMKTSLHRVGCLSLWPLGESLKKRASKFKKALIGINNRNLDTLKVDINTTFNIYPILKDHPMPLISESGIKNKEDILEIKNKTKIKTFLIGESILKNLDKNNIFSVL